MWPKQCPVSILKHNPSSSSPNQHTPTNVEKLRGRPWGIGGHAANTFFVQFTFFGSVFALFLNALGMSKSEMGAVFSLIPFASLIALFISPWTGRFGYKRAFLTFFGSRKIITLFILFTPLIGSDSGRLIYVTIIVAIFALMRASAETARFPWMQEYIPKHIQGKYTATNNFFVAIAGVIAVTVAGYTLELFASDISSGSLTAYLYLITAGVIFGFISVWLFSFIPGGAPLSQVSASTDSATTDATAKPKRDLREAIRDRNFRNYLIGFGLIILATVPLNSFLPLFMRESVGLADSQVVYLQIGTLLATLLTSLVWGWAADRYGSKPVMLSGLCLRLFLPILWFILPTLPLDWRLNAALAIAFLQGMADMGWGIGSARLLFVDVVPSEKKADYMALYYTCLGLTGGISQLLGGTLIDASQSIAGQQFMGLSLDAYSPLLGLNLTLLVLSILILGRVRIEAQYTLRKFAGIFLRGNPFLAMGSLMRYQFAKNEEAAVKITEQLGRSRSLLTAEELLEALQDPRFSVRFEAIISIARMKPDPLLTQALIQILEGRELALSSLAAWALGRMGDADAIEPLTRALDSRYHSIQAHSARALGMLNASGLASDLLQRLEDETEDRGLRMAYSAALGRLGAVDATQTLLRTLHETENRGARVELTLHLARLIGRERAFIQRLRQVRSDLGTTAAQVMTTIHKRQRRLPQDPEALHTHFRNCIDAFANDDLARGIQEMSLSIERVQRTYSDDTARMILQECAQRLKEEGKERTEYILLALHILEHGA